MLERIKYRYRLWKLKRSMKRTVNVYDSHITKVQNDNREQQSLVSEARFLIGEEDHKIR